MIPPKLVRARMALAFAVLGVVPAMAQSGPFVTASSGLVTFSTSIFGEQNNHTKRRDAISVGYVLSDLVAFDLSYFQVQSTEFTESFVFPGNSYSDTERDKLSGFAFGPVLRWKLADGVTVFTRQSAVAITDEETVTIRGYNVAYTTTSKSNRTFWGYQPSVGINFRLTTKAPVSLGVELNHVFTGNGRVKDMTGLLLNLSYGF